MQKNVKSGGSMSQKVLFFLPKVYYTDTEAAQKRERISQLWLLQDAMSAKPAALITKEPLTMEPSSTLPTTAVSRWSLSAAQAR